MKKNRKYPNILFFCSELLLTIFIPFIIWWSFTPTNILNSNFLFSLLELIGIGGSTVIFFAGIPLGILGICKAKKIQKLKTPTLVLSIVNLTAGIFEVATLILIFCRVIFGGVSV